MAQDAINSYTPSPSEQVKYALMERLRRVLPRNTADTIAKGVGFVGSMVDPVEAVRSWDNSAQDFRQNVQNKNIGGAGVALAGGILGAAPTPAGRGASRIEEVLTSRQAPAIGFTKPQSFTMAHSSPKSGIREFNWRDNLHSGEGASVFGAGLYGSERVMQNRRQGYPSMAKRKGGATALVSGVPINDAIAAAKKELRDVRESAEDAWKASYNDPALRELSDKYQDEKVLSLDRLYALQDLAWASGAVNNRKYPNISSALLNRYEPDEELPQTIQQLIRAAPPVEVGGEGSQYLLRVNTPEDALFGFDEERNFSPIGKALLGRMEAFRDAELKKMQPDAVFGDELNDSYIKAIDQKMSGINLLSSRPEWKSSFSSLLQHLGPGHKVMLSDAMQDAGVPGIKYRDAWSRGDNKTPTHNYVVFDDKNLVEVLKERQLNPKRELEW